MRTLLFSLLLLSFSLVPVQAQLATSLLDDFARADANDLGMTPTSPTQLQWSEAGEEVGSESNLTAEETIRIQNERSDLQAGQKEGVKRATVDLSGVSGYPTTLDEASDVMTWAFNVRQSKSNPGGFGSTGDGGVLFSLAADGSDLSGSANAFAVIIGSDGGTDPVKLVNYNGGYSANGDFDLIVEGSTDRSNDYVSVKVTYDNSTSPDTWTVYAQSDPNDFPVSDPRTLGNNSQIGQTQADFSGTSNQRKILGLLWDHGASSENAVFDDIYISDPSKELPVELTSFDVTLDGQAANLTWKTASETNNSGFEIQRKADGTFQKIGFVDGAGTTSTPQEYTFSTSTLSPGTHTFRLRQIDADGTSHLTPARTVVVEASESGLTTTGPNPVSSGETASFVLSTEQVQPVTVTLVDALGRTVRTIHDGTTAATPTRLTVETEALSSGVYFIHANGQTFTATRKFSVVR